MLCKLNCKELFLMWLRLQSPTHWKKMVWRSCLKSWLRLSFHNSITFAYTQCSTSISKGVCVRRKDSFSMSWRELKNLTNTSYALHEVQVLLKRYYWKNISRNTSFQLHGNQNSKKIRLIDLLQRIAIIKNSQSETSFFVVIDWFFDGLAAFEIDSVLFSV